MSSVVHTEARPVTPLGILVEHLATAVQLVESESSVPAEVVAHLQKALQLAAGIEPYIGELTSPESAALVAIAQKTRSEQWGKHSEDGSTVRPLEQKCCQDT